MVPVTILTGFLGSGKTTLVNRVIKETTRMADPGPVAQSFFIDEKIGNYYLLDSVITVVDAKHAPKQLDEFREAQEQVGFADRILMSKTDLVSEADQEKLKRRLAKMNPRAPIRNVHFGDTPIEEVLDIRGFNLNATLELDPDFLEDGEHEHDEHVSSFVFRSDQPFDSAKLEEFLSGVVQIYGPDMLRYNGI